VDKATSDRQSGPIWPRIFQGFRYAPPAYKRAPYLPALLDVALNRNYRNLAIVSAEENSMAAAGSALRWRRLFLPGRHWLKMDECQ
jgi:hypothetical protein